MDRAIQLKTRKMGKPWDRSIARRLEPLTQTFYGWGIFNQVQARISLRASYFATMPRAPVWLSVTLHPVPPPWDPVLSRLPIHAGRVDFAESGAERVEGRKSTMEVEK